MNAYGDAVDPLEALGDATRRAIVEGLQGGERTVGDLAASMPVSRPAVSQHLGVLRAAGLVLERPEGTRRWYRLDPIGLVRLQARLDAMWGLETDAAPAARPISEPAGSAGAEEGAPKPERPARAAREATAPPPAPAPEAPAKGGRKKRKKKGGRK